MPPLHSKPLVALATLITCLERVGAQTAPAMQIQAVPIGVIDESSQVTLKGNRHPLATAANDRGEVSPGPSMEPTLLVFGGDGWWEWLYAARA